MLALEQKEQLREEWVSGCCSCFCHVRLTQQTYLKMKEDEATGFHPPTCWTVTEPFMFGGWLWGAAHSSEKPRFSWYWSSLCSIKAAFTLHPSRPEVSDCEAPPQGWGMAAGGCGGREVRQRYCVRWKGQVHAGKNRKSVGCPSRKKPQKSA